MHDEKWFPILLLILGIIAALLIIFYLYKWSKKRDKTVIFWFTLIMLSIAFSFLLEANMASGLLTIPTFIGLGYFLWRFIKADTRIDKLGNLLFAGALFFFGLSFSAYAVMEYIIPAVVLLAGGIVVEFKKLEK